MKNQSYIYFHINPLTNKVFYVGKGTGDRAWDKWGRSNYWYNIVNKYGYIIDIVEDNLTDNISLQREIFYINKIGRKDLGLGTLVNHTNGGEGNSGFKFSQESKEKMSKAKKGNKINLGKKCSQETKQKISNANKGNKVNLGKTHSDETKLKQSESQKLRWKNKKGE